MLCSTASKHSGVLQSTRRGKNPAMLCSTHDSRLPATENDNSTWAISQSTNEAQPFAARFRTVSLMCAMMRHVGQRLYGAGSSAVRRLLSCVFSTRPWQHAQYCIRRSSMHSVSNFNSETVAWKHASFVAMSTMPIPRNNVFTVVAAVSRFKPVDDQNLPAPCPFGWDFNSSRVGRKIS